MHRWIALGCVLLLAACGEPKVVSKSPMLYERTVTTAEDTPIAVEVSLTAQDVGAVALSVVTSPSHGTLTGNGPTWTYTPAANYNGSDLFVVRGEDGFGTTTARVTMHITPVNDAPVANPDSFADGFNIVLHIPLASVLANDIDVDGTALAVTGVAATAHGAPVLGTDEIVFTPELGFEGAASFEYTVSDGTLTAHATVTIAIGVDHPPVAVDDAVTTDEDTVAVIADATLLANDSDVDHQTLRIAAVGNPSHGSVTHSGTQVAFVPDADFHGTAGFDYTVTDGFKTDAGSVVVTVSSVDDPPVAVDDVATVAEGVIAASLGVVANDTDVDGGPKAVASITQPRHGSATIGASGLSVLYTPAPGYCNEAPNAARDTFMYTLTPGGSSATVSVTVLCACGEDKPTDFVVGSNG